MATPQLLSRKVNGAAPSAPGQAPGEAPKQAKTKAPMEGEKVVIRRLPPGMTEDEFSNILGDTWKSGNGKVGWYQYHPGKISKDPAKPSRPSRAYLHVLRRDDLLALSDAVRTSAWEDARESWTDAALVGPPMIEQCIYKKITSGKRRSDGRQGTIDQDREFMAFLESLANPEGNKDADADQSTDDGAKPEKATTTPLIEYLKERKANKAKDAAAAKSAKHARQESHGAKAKGSSSNPEESKKKSKGDKSSDKPKETVKILTKKEATEAAASAAKSAVAQIQSGTQDVPKSRRAGIAAAARILQRDLGLSPGNAHRKARQEAAKAEAEAKTATATEKETASSSAQTPASPTVPTARPATPTAAPTAPKAQPQLPTSSARSRGKKRGTGEDSAKGKGDKSAADAAAPATAKTPVVLLKKKDETLQTSSQNGRPSSASASTSGPTTAATPTPAGPSGPKSSKPTQQPPVASKKAGSSAAAATPTPGSTRAFVKHANPSQGVTEALLKEAMHVFGAVTFVEIDRRKGFAYVDFAEPEGLARAMAANPVAVAQAAVQVLERRDKEPPSRKGGAGGGKGAAGSSAGAGGSKGEASAGTGSAPTTPSGPPADKEKGAGATAEKRGGRRRGGRGRDRDRDGGAGKGASKSGGGGGGGGTAAAAT